MCVSLCATVELEGCIKESLGCVYFMPDDNRGALKSALGVENGGFQWAGSGWEGQHVKMNWMISY